MTTNSRYKETLLEKHIRRVGFVNGIYTPWFNGLAGRDIGSSILNGYADCAFDKNRIYQVLFNCHAMGFDMAKIWLNENLEGMLFDEKGRVTGVEPQYYDNLKTISQMAYELELQLCFCVVAHNECIQTKRQYDKYMRYIQVEEETEHYIKNWLNPVIQLTEQYPNITLIDVYAEPEADACLWNLSRGVSWSSMKRFINRVSAAVKEQNPLVATTVSSYNPQMLERNNYDRIKTDYIGADVYNEEGRFPHTVDLVMDRPFMLGEYGLENRYANDEQQIDAIKKFQDSIERYRVQGAFFWHYGWLRRKDADKPVKQESHDGELGLTASYYHFWALDREYKLTGYTGYDSPKMLYIESPKKIRWFGTRDAESYLLERQNYDGNWEEITRISAQPKYPQHPEILRWSDINTDGFAYRVISLMPDGTRMVSDTAYVERREENT